MHKMKLLRQVGHYLRGARSRLSSERHSINASYPPTLLHLDMKSRGPRGKGAGDSLLPEGMTKLKTDIVFGHLFGVWLSGAITAMALEQVWDSVGPAADTGINI